MLVTLKNLQQETFQLEVDGAITVRSGGELRGVLGTRFKAKWPFKVRPRYLSPKMR